MAILFQNIQKLILFRLFGEQLKFRANRFKVIAVYFSSSYFTDLLAAISDDPLLWCKSHTRFVCFEFRWKELYKFKHPFTQINYKTKQIKRTPGVTLYRYIRCSPAKTKALRNFTSLQISEICCNEFFFSLTVFTLVVMYCYQSDFGLSTTARALNNMSRVVYWYVHMKWPQIPTQPSRCNCYWATLPCSCKLLLPLLLLLLLLLLYC